MQLQQDRDYWLKAFNALHEADAVEPFQLKEARECVLQRFAESDKKILATETVAGLKGQQPPAPPPSPGPQAQQMEQPESGLQREVGGEI